LTSSQKSQDLFPVALSDGSTKYISQIAPPHMDFIYEEFARLEEKFFKEQVHNWHDDPIENLTSQVHMRSYVDLAKDMSNTYLEIAPIKITNSFLNLVEVEGIGILTNEALIFFWESRKRSNIVALAHTASASLRELGAFEFSSINRSAVVRRSPDAEMLENETWTFMPSLNNNANRNADSFKIFFSLLILQARNQEFS